MHYYQFHIGDYATHTRHLTPIEDIAYRRLLDIYYLHERPLSDCSTTVARQINMREYEDEVDLILTEFFDHIDGGYINRRADKEIKHYKAKVEQASRAGRASAERRTNGRSTDVQPTSNQEPITIVKAKQSRGTRLPADWAISVENIEFCNKTRPDLSPMQTASRFKDYWTAQPGSKGVKLDWDATWRNWVRAERSKDTVSKPQALVGWK